MIEFIFTGLKSCRATAPPIFLRGMASVAHSGRRLRGKQPRTLCYVDGDSSGDDEEAEALTAARCECGQFVWSCPREYPADLQARKLRKWLIPADLSKAEAGQLFKTVVTSFGHGPNLVKIHVFDEPHKKYNRATGAPEASHAQDHKAGDRPFNAVSPPYHKVGDPPFNASGAVVVSTRLSIEPVALHPTRLCIEGPIANLMIWSCSVDVGVGIERPIANLMPPTPSPQGCCV